MKRLRRSREQVVAEVVAGVIGASVTAVFTIIVFSDLTIGQRVRIFVVAAVIYAALLAVAWLRGRRHRREKPRRLTKADRQALEQAVRGAGQLPAHADESWRSELREEVIGHSFPASWTRYGPVIFGAMIFTPAWTGEGDLSDLDVAHLLTIIGVSAVIAALVAWGFAHFSRARVRNALSMLEQLDARTTE